MRKLITVLLLILLAIGEAGITYAQDVEKKPTKKQARKERHEKKEARKRSHMLEKAKRKETRKKEKQEHKKLKRENRKLKKKGKGKEAGEPVAKKTEVVYPATRMKPRYRIDVLALMYLDEAKNYKIPDKALPAIAFYEGVNIAADTLKKAGFNIDIYVHDVASATESSEMLVKKNMLDSSDLIIGAVPFTDVPLLADYANKKQINFISALSPSDGNVRDNKYFTLLQPSLKSHCEWIAGDVAKKFPGMRISLLYRTSMLNDSNAYNFMINSDAPDVNFVMLSCNSLPGKEKLRALFDSARPNVVVVSILDFSYADSILNEISHDFPETHFEIYGMPSWNSISNLRKEKAFPNLSVNVTTPFYFDTTGMTAKYVAQTFRRDYGGKMTDFVYRGYEAMFWYANLLKKYGTIFNEKYNDNTAAPFTKFDIKPRWNKNGEMLFDENTRIFMSKYEGGNSKTQ